MVCVFGIVSVSGYNMAIGCYKILGIYKERDGNWLLDSVGIWDRDGKWLPDSMGIWDSKTVWDVIWL